MLKPLSAITSSPSSNLSKNPLSCVILLSLTLPVQKLDTKLNVPVGVIPTRVLILLCSLYSLQVYFCADGRVGFSIKTAVQSITTRVFGKRLNSGGSLVWICSLVGQIIKLLSS